MTESRRARITGIPWTARSRTRPRGERLLAACGIAGPAVFTAAWVVSSLRQPGYGAGQVQLSGLASLEARDPQIMMAGFIGLGVCSVAFGGALARVTAPDRAGAWLVRTAGVAVVAAGLFRRDHMLITGPGLAGESWHNQVHDAVSGVAYVTMIVAPLVLARRFRRDPEWAGLSRPLEVITLTSAAALALFASQAVEPWNAVLQRFAVTLPLTVEALMAARTLAPATAPMRTRRAARLSWKARAGARRDP